MEQGSLSELVLSRSVTKHIKKQNKSFKEGTGIGHDFTRMPIDSDTPSLISSEAVSSRAEIAWVKACNNFYVSGGRALYARVTALLPEDTGEAAIKAYMGKFNGLAEAEGIQLAGGHTQVSKAYNEISFVVTITGVSGSYRHNKKLIAPGCDIIMLGYTGMLGTDVLEEQREEELSKRFSQSYIHERTPWDRNYSIRYMAEKLSEKEDVYYMHDVSNGGVYAALWQLGAYSNRGISVGHFSIPVIQKTIEYCEVFGLNPYMLEGTGALLAVVKAGAGTELAEELNACGIDGAVIGHVESDNDRMIYLGDALTVTTRQKNSPEEAAFFMDADSNYIERRCLSPMKGDEIYKAVTSL